jgi:hypothetical protein
MLYRQKKNQRFSTTFMPPWISVHENLYQPFNLIIIKEFFRVFVLFYEPSHEILLWKYHKIILKIIFVKNLVQIIGLESADCDSCGLQFAPYPP